MKPSSLAALAALFWVPVAATAQNPADTGAGAARVSYTLAYTVKAASGTENLRLNALVPRTLPGRQKILKIDYSVKPSKTFEQDGDAYAEFFFARPAGSTEVAITVDAEINRYDLATATEDKSNRQFEDKADLKKWLRHEDYLEKDAPEIVEAAKDLLGKTEVETVRKTMAFVASTVRSGPYDPADRGALWALHKKQGDCTEYADLFIALCRANNLPARFRQGFLVSVLPEGSTPKHDWAEVYLADYGWVPFDPRNAAGAGAPLDKMEPIYLYLDVLRRNSVLNGYHYWCYRCSGRGCKDSTLGEEFKLNSRNELNPK
jgi:transglutaminase-like putative cysteine protease